MKTQKLKLTKLVATTFTVFVLIIFVIPFQTLAEALTVTKDSQAPVENRFVVGPAKLEATIPPGESKEVGIDIENRMGRTAEFDIHFEDFTASSDSATGVALLGDKSSASSLKNMLSVPENKIVLNQGDRVHVPITITTLGNEDLGGKYGAVVVSSHAVSQSTAEPTIGTTVIGEVAVLLFVTIPGDIKSNAILESFTIARGQKMFFTAPVRFEVAVKNSGTVHVNPYGGITIRNMFGQTIAKVPIDPWFVLPNSVRTRDIAFAQNNLFGWYSATLELNRGYNDVVDTRTVSFFALSPKTLALLVLVLLAFLFLLKKKIGQTQQS